MRDSSRRAAGAPLKLSVKNQYKSANSGVEVRISSLLTASSFLFFHFIYFMAGIHKKLSIFAIVEILLAIYNNYTTILALIFA